ncbi:MFS transporter [Planktothrix agardhii]|uniref:MFS transporter n=1 Tax=Planktothrix agardhii TaxID=1160 RepID=UPI0020A7F2BC|nr:MFS transporter [Planktothrix agardhii]CAD5943572.1 putative MFS-type transporter YwoG [Planktothrix agardhii]
MNAFRRFEPKCQRSLLALFIAGLCFWTSITTLLPTLPLYIESLGGTTQQIGWVMGAFALGLLPSRLWFGPLADRKSRKLVLLIGTIVGTMAPLGYLFAESIPSLLSLRAFHGISVAAFTIGYSALVADIAPVERRGEVIGYMSLVAPIGMAIGPAVGGEMQAMVGYDPIFLSSSGFAFLAFLGICQVWEPQHNKPTTKADSTSLLEKGLWFFKTLWSPPLRIPAFVLLMVGLIFGTLVTFLPLAVKESGLNFNAGLFYSTAAIASFLIRIPTGRASDRYGRGLFITGGLICYFLAMLLLSQTMHSNIILLAALLEGMGAGVVLPMMITLITDRCLPEQRGQFFSLCLTGFDLGIALAGPIFGIFAEQLGYSVMFALDAGLALIALISFATFSNKTIRLSLKFAFGQSKDIYSLN